MGNISFDFSSNNILYPKGKENTPFTYKDVGTSKIRLVKDIRSKEEHIADTDSSNIDMNAIKASLNNILSFKTCERILDPEFGIGPIYELLYSPFDKYTTQKMINTLKDIIAKYEPRIEIESMPTTYDEDKHEFLFTINYYVPALLMKDSFQLSLAQ